jgi:hypothetical protein
VRRDRERQCGSVQRTRSQAIVARGHARTECECVRVCGRYGMETAHVLPLGDTT